MNLTIPGLSGKIAEVIFFIKYSKVYYINVLAKYYSIVYYIEYRPKKAYIEHFIWT